MLRESEAYVTYYDVKEGELHTSEEKVDATSENELPLDEALFSLQSLEYSRRSDRLFTEDTLKWYLQQNGPYPATNAEWRERNRQLAQLIAEGDEDAFAEMVRINQPLVVRIVRPHLAWHRNVDILEFTQEGNVGLIRAVQGYRLEKGYEFSTYAWHAIENTIRRFIKRLPPHNISGDAPEGEEGSSLFDLMPSEGPEPSDVVADKIELDWLLALVSPEQLEIIRLHYLREPPLTFRAIAREMGLTTWGARELNRKAFELFGAYTGVVLPKPKRRVRNRSA